MASTQTPKRRVHLWNTLERHMVFIELTEYEQTSAECARLFNYHFAANFAVPPDAERIRDEYATRNGGGRSKMWEREIERTTYTAQQGAERAQARQMIQVAAQALGITLNPRAGTASAGAGAESRAAQTHANANPTNAADDDSDDSSILSSPPASPLAPLSPTVQGSSGAADTTASPSGSKQKRDEDSDDSSVLSSPPASPIAGPLPASQVSSGAASNSAGPSSSKRKREDEEESEAVKEGQTEPSDSDADEEEPEHAQVPTSPSGHVQVPPPPSTTPAQEGPKKNKTSSTNGRPAKKRRATRQTTREDDEARNARPGFPEKYLFMARHQFEPNSRLLALLDKKWEQEQSAQAQQASAKEAEQAPAEVQQPPVQPDAQVAAILRQAAAQAARIAKARAFGDQILARTVVPSE